jgi:hypothetical protein
MANLPAIITVFLLAITLEACGTADDSRYRSTEILEKPPILAVEKQAGNEVIEVDDSVIPKKTHEKGLDDNVYVIASKPPQLKIKQPFDTAWHTLGLALQQGDIKITDQEQKKGVYFVAYGPKTLADVLPFVKTEPKETIYMLTVKADGAETSVTSTIAGAAEQSNLYARLDDEDYKTDADDLLMSVFETLRDDLVEE